jgi:putative hydrolase of the HAD superfamily
MPSTPSAVLLDVGGVFLLPSRSHIRSALAQVGHEVAEDSAIDRAHYLATRVFPMDLDRDDWMGPHWNDYLHVYARSLKVPEEVMPEAVEHLRNEYVTGWLWDEEIEGSREGLRRLADTGVHVGVVSNADGTIEQRLLDRGILQVGRGNGVEVICLVDSGAVGVEKPDPRIFDFALEVLEVDRDDVWYVGDTPGFDVAGAQRAGLTPILMDPFDVNGDFGVTTVASLTELAEMIETERSPT